MTRREGSESSLFPARDSLFLLAEELKQSLSAIAQSEERGDSHATQIEARLALQTIDAIILGEKVASGQVLLDLQPVHVGSVMTDVRDRLRPAFKQRHIAAELSLKRGLALIDTDKRLLSGVLTSLWQVMLSNVEDHMQITCTAKSYRGGVRVALVSDGAQLQQFDPSQLQTASSQPINSLSGSGSNILAAVNLSSLLGLQLTTSRHSIGVTLPKSSQLSLV